MKVKANKKFNDYRLNVLKGLDKKDFRALQQGKTVDIKQDLYDKYPQIFEVIEKEPPKKKEEVK